MKTVAVIIPYFQTESGILRRALASVIAQDDINDVHVDVIIVDDGSPAPLADELNGLEFLSGFHLTLITQANSGVSAARNAGLKQTTDKTDFIAFLDSDDTWSPSHLALALKAMDDGYQLYFADNMRRDHHKSYFSECCPKIRDLANAAQSDDGLVPIDKHHLVSLILEHFPVHTSSVVYKRKDLSNHTFQQTQHFAGEDLIFLVGLALAATKICFSPAVMIECGRGVNMYFDSIKWDSPKLLAVLSDQIRAFNFMKSAFSFNSNEYETASKVLSKHKKNFVFHAIRMFVKKRGKFPRELFLLSSEDRNLFFWFAGYFGLVVVERLTGRLKPA